LNYYKRNKNPELSIYIDDFGTKDDCCFVAEIDCNIIGVVWTRRLASGIKGYVNIDENTCICYIYFNGVQGIGIGTELMSRMIEELKIKGYKNISLSIDKKNYAAKMYKNLGFNVIDENENGYLMLLNLQKN